MKAGNKSIIAKSKAGCPHTCLKMPTLYSYWAYFVATNICSQPYNYFLEFESLASRTYAPGSHLVATQRECILI